MPLIALTADRPPELRGIGAGQTIDQIKLYGSAVRWFCEVGTHEADDDGLLHYRSTACRAFAAARGEARPGAGPSQPALARAAGAGPGRGRGHGHRPAGARGARRAAADRGRPRSTSSPPGSSLEEVAKHIGDAISGVIVAGRQLDPELREPLAHLAAAAGFPILAEPTSQLRCGPHDRSHVVAAYDLLLRDERFRAASTPDLVLRFGEMPTSKPLRAWLARRAPTRSSSTPAAAGTSRRAARRRSCAPTRPSSPRAGRRGSSAATASAPSAGSTAERAARGGDRRGARRARRADHRARPAPGARRRPPRRRPRLHGLEHADPRPGGLPARRTERDVLFLSNRGANGIDGLVSSGIGAAHASGRPTTIVTGDLGLLHDIGGLAALREVSTPVRIVVIDNDGGGIFHFLPQEAALERDEFEALLGTPRGVDVARAAALFELPHRRLDSLDELPGALAAGTGLIEVADRPPRQRRGSPPAPSARRRLACSSAGDRARLAPRPGLPGGPPPNRGPVG